MKAVSLLISLLLVMPTVWATPSFSFWHAHHTNDYVETLVHQFEQQTGSVVRLRRFSNPDALRDALLLAAHDGVLPDVVYVPSDQIGLHFRVPLMAIPSAWYGDVQQSAQSPLTRLDEQQRAVLVTVGNQLLLYLNNQLMKQPITHFEQLIELAPYYRSGKPQLIQWASEDAYWFVPFLHARAGRLIVGRYPQLDTLAMRQALNDYRYIIDTLRIDRSCDDRCSTKRFKLGEAVLLISGDWRYYELKGYFGDDLTVLSLPSLGDKPLTSYYGGYALAFPQQAHKANTLQLFSRFVAFWLSEEAQQQVWQIAGLVPVNQHVRERLTASGQRPLPLIQPEQYNKPLENTPALLVSWLVLSQGYQRFMEQRFNVDETAIWMQQTAENYLQVKP